MTITFIKLIRESEESDYLQENYPNACLLLMLIAKRARRTPDSPDGLQIGEAHIGDFKKAGLKTRGEYRHALQILEHRAHIKIIETSRTRKKATNGTTTEGTKVKLLRSDIWDININDNNHRNNHRTTIEQPSNNHEQECKECKNDKKINTHPLPSNPESADADCVNVSISPKPKKLRTTKRKEVSQSAKDLYPQFIAIIVAFKPNYVAKKQENIMAALDEMLADGRKPEEILRVLDWAVRDNTIRGNWDGWSSKVICDNPASYLAGRFDRIEAASRSKTLSRFASFSDIEQSEKIIQLGKENAI